MSTTVYDIGDTVRLSTTIQNSTGAYTSATVTLVIQTPSSTDRVIASGSLTSTATGRYRYDFQPDVAGRWAYEFRSTGTVKARQGDAFAVRPTIASTQ